MFISFILNGGTLDENWKMHNHPDCDGNGYVECEHGVYGLHEYCSHGYMNKHDE